MLFELDITLCRQNLISLHQILICLIPFITNTRLKNIKLQHLSFTKPIKLYSGIIRAGRWMSFWVEMSEIDLMQLYVKNVPRQI